MLMNYEKPKNKIILYQTNQDLPLEIQERRSQAWQDLDRAAITQHCIGIVRQPRLILWLKVL